MKYKIHYSFSDGSSPAPFLIQAPNKLEAIRELDKHLEGLGKIIKEDYSRRSLDKIEEVTA
jgi:hypothetical protein